MLVSLGVIGNSTIADRALVALLNGSAPNTHYFTLPQDLPLLQPLRLPAEVLSKLSGKPVPTPLADALQPALKILVNLGYTDVEPTNDYNRALNDAGTPTPFFTLPDLTLAQWAAVPRAVLTALVDGFATNFAPSALKSGFTDYVAAWTAVLSKLFSKLGLSHPLSLSQTFSPPAATDTTSALPANSARVVSISATNQQPPPDTGATIRVGNGAIDVGPTTHVSTTTATSGRSPPTGLLTSVARAEPTTAHGRKAKH